jgi:Ni,Fe-hydrogenase maturation factor
MNIYVFGNEDLEIDNPALEIANKLKNKIKDINFVIVKPNEDLPFIDGEENFIMDVVEDLNEIKIVEDNNIEKILLSPRNTTHDFDLAFQLKYLKKIGKIGKVTIIGIPQKKKVDYEIFQSILRKLVAQDMQGS